MHQKIHISLVGGQTMPVYLGIAETNPDKIVLVHSDKTLSQAKRIAESCKGETILVSFPPVDITEILSSVDKLFSQYAGEDITVNLTGGTKPWAIAFAMKAQPKDNVRLIYIDQNCVFYDYTSHDTSKIVWQPQLALDMETLMHYNGQAPWSHATLEKFEDDDKYVLEKVKKLRKQSPVNFNELTIDTERKAKSGSSFMLRNGSYIEWDRKAHNVHMLLMTRWSKLEEDLSSPNVMKIVFNSGWFEYEVALIMNRWAHTKELWMNVVYKTADGRKDKNEIDVIVNTGVKLLIVECKTQIHSITDIDKFRNAVKNYGGMGCKALFVTESSMRPEAVEKCRDSDIIPFSLSAYPDIRTARKSLYQLLDKELFNLNAR